VLNSKYIYISAKLDMFSHSKTCSA